MRIPLINVIGNLRNAADGMISACIVDYAYWGIPLIIEGSPVDPNFGTNGINEFVDVEEDYFFRTHFDRGIPIGKENSGSYLSPKGFESLKPKIKEVYDRLCVLPDAHFRPRSSWDELEAGVPKFYEQVKLQTAKRIKEMQDKLAQLEVEYTKHFS
jgi:hypothetical protein